MPHPPSPIPNPKSQIASPFGVYVVLGLLLWPVPLLNVLHVESSAVVAGVAFFTAGLLSVGAFRGGASLRRVLGVQEAALLVPWAMLTVSLLWAPNCGYLQGLLFYLLFAPFSVALAVALAYAVSGLRVRFPRRLFGGIGLVVVLLGPVYDLGFHPQFYVYNHVFGGVLGPVYDEELALRGGLFAFRSLTLLWTVLLYLVGRRLRWEGRGGSDVARTGRLPRQTITAPITTVAVGIGLMYAFAGPLGINTPAWYLRAQLGAVYRTPHFDIYYDSAALTADELRHVGQDHEFHYARLAALLDVEVEERIASYLYPDPETKARLTGARYTNVAPVWLAEPQTHVLLEAYSHVFPHELAHVFSRAFGLPVLNASVLVGLVEGLAVALEPPDGLPSVHDQVITAALARIGPEELGEETLAAALASRLSPFGFWTGRGAVSYAAMGSFVGYLLDAYGPERLKAVYAWGDFDAVYGRTPAALAAEWQAFLTTRPTVARASDALVTARFTVPSLFEKPCPHYVPPYRRAFVEAAEAYAAGDTVRAWQAVTASLAREPAYVPALDLWARLALAREAPGDVVARLDAVGVDTVSAALSLRLADALALQGQVPRAGWYYTAAYERLPLYAYEERALVVIRKSLAGQPSVVRTLVSGLPPDEQARRLAAAADTSAAVATLRAVLLARDGQYEQARHLLRTTSPPLEAARTPAQRNLLRWQRWTWLAEFSHRGGHPDAAAAYAERAARALREAGDFDEAARLAVFVEKMAFVDAMASARGRREGPASPGS